MKLSFLKSTAAFVFVFAAAAGAAKAAEPASCGNVNVAQVSWTDIQATTGAVETVLAALGYKVEVKELDLPIIYTGMANKQLDFFVGNWMPSSTQIVKPFTDAKTVDTVRANLEGAKYTLSTNEYGAALGIKDFADIAKHKKELDGKIYGIEPGNDGNKNVLDLIKDNKFGLKDFKLVESSEQGMLAQVAKLDKARSRSSSSAGRRTR